MGERDVGLNRTPDRTSQPLSLTTERLGLAFQARQDFARALNIAGSITADASRAYTFIHIGRAQVRSGIDPSPSLTGLTQLTEEPGQIDHQIIHEGIAKVHIDAGNFERAQALADNIRGYNPILEAQTRMRALQHIAQEQVARGLYQDAIANAHLAIQTVEQAEVKPEHLRAHIEHDQIVGVIKLLALIAKAQGLSGEDSSETLGTALERVNQIPHNGYWKMDVLVEIARAQREIGIDTTPTLARALAELDAMPQAADYDNYIDLAQHLLGYNELAKVQAEFGQIDEARVILSRLENFNPDDADTKDMVAEVLADIAETEAKQGLTPDELTTLSQEEIRAILQGNNELAKQSARYFGLDKKVV